MTDDLVKRLRDECEDANDPIFMTRATLLKAANRIEKLEAALRAIVVHCEVPSPPNAEALIMFARKALEGKDDC